MGNKLFCSLALAASLPVFSAGCASTTVKQPGAQQNWMEKATSGVTGTVKSGSSRVAAALTPKREAATATTPAPNGKPGPGVFVAMAQISERGENFDEAEAQYKKALDIDGNHLPALVGYAHLEDRRSHLESATRLYQKAAKKYPKEASVHNDLGLCYHRRGMLNDATKSLRRAVELKGDNKLYRNNLAAVYVEQGKRKEALEQLIAAHGEAAAHYNLGYLLAQKHDNATTLDHFRTAAAKDPSLVAAQQWIAKIQATDGPAGPRVGDVAVGTSGYGFSAPPQYGPSGRFVPPTASGDSNGAGNVSQASQYPTGGTADNRGLQYPSSRRQADPAGYAVPPTPGVSNASRLPTVGPASG